MKRIAFYGGSFDPPHNGHLTIARRLIDLFELDEFFFIPAFHAPHKINKPSSAVHRFAMLALASNDKANIKISTVELDAPEKPFTVETQTKLKNHLPNAEIFFVIGADSWTEITTWREWEKILTQTNIIVVTRPHFEIGFSHVTPEIRARIIDRCGQNSDSRLQIPDSELNVSGEKSEILNCEPETRIFITDAVQIDVSATEIRQKVREKQKDWRELVPPEVAKYIEKYELYI